MTEDLHNIDKLFKAAIDNHEEAPADESWKVIDKELDRNNIVSIRKKYAALKKLVAVLLLLLSGVIIYEWHAAYSSKTINTSAANSNQLNTNNSNSIAAINKNNTATDHNNAGDPSKTNQNSEPVNNKNTTRISTTEQNSVLLNNNNASVKSNEISIAKTLPLLNLKESNTITTPVIATGKTTAENNITANNSIKIKKKGSFFARSTSATISDDAAALAETITASDNNNRGNNKTTSKQYSTGLLKPISRQAVVSQAATGFATQPVTLQNNILPKPFIKNNSATADTKSTLNKASRFSATVFYSPSLPSDLIEDDDDKNRSNNPRDDAAHIKKGEHQSSYSLGASIEYAISKHWSIQSGLTFIQKVSHINQKTIYAEYAGNGNIGYLFNFSSGYSYLPSKSNALAIGDSAQALRSTNILQYLCIPLQAKYTVSKGKFNFNIALGASYNILLKGALETEVANDTATENETVNKITGLKQGYISGLMGIGAEYPVTKKIALCFNPSFNMAITSITQGAPVRSYPSFFSFAAGLHIKL